MRRAFLITVFSIHVLLLLGSLRQNYVTVDEVGHIPAGLCHWKSNTFTMYRVNPPLPDMLAALPMLFAHPKCNYQILFNTIDNRPEWLVGRDFAATNASRYFDLACLARLPGIFWSLLGGFVIYLWGCELYGDRAGCLGALLWCFEPTIFAFAQLVVPDIPATVAGLLATYVYWHYLRSPNLRTAYVAGVLLGIAELTKFTLLSLYPIWLLLWLLYRLWPIQTMLPTRPLRTVFGHLFVIFGLSLFIINLGYAFHKSCTSLGDIPFVSKTFVGENRVASRLEPERELPNRFRHGLLASLPVPLPADYVRGIDIQKRDFETKFWSYLRGEWRLRGWWYYYVYALVVKVPLGLWAMVAWSVALSVFRSKNSAAWQDELVLWIPFAFILTFVSSQTGFNHHMRYILPIFPFAIVSTSKLARFITLRHWKTGTVLFGFVFWFVVSELAIYPHSMSYFNEAAGGPEHGSEHLLDSNIDWGQDLLFLKKWLDQHSEARPLGLAYHNFIDPHLMGIEFELPPRIILPPWLESSDYTHRWDPRPGYYAVSVIFVRGKKFYVVNGRGQLDIAALHDYEYFRFFKPIATAGYSIFIYHITHEEANRVRHELGLPLLADETFPPES